MAVDTRHPTILIDGLDELTCELNSRPDWVRIPLAGLLRLASG
jgi:predicted trehalose synthase